MQTDHYHEQSGHCCPQSDHKKLKIKIVRTVIIIDFPLTENFWLKMLLSQASPDNVCCLQELDVWGGDFYSDDFYFALEQIGPQLTKLNLVHIEELDKRAIVMISQSCCNLKKIGFYNCGFREPNRVQEERNEEDAAFAALDRFARIQEDQMVIQWLNVEKLNITSEVR